MTTPTAEELAAPIVEELKSPGKFDLKAALAKTSYPTEDVTIYLDGDSTHERNLVLDVIADLEIKSESLSAKAQGSMVDDPEKEEVDETIGLLEKRAEELLETVRSSALTFTLRGVAPKQWRLIDKEARRKIKPATKSEDDQFEAQLLRNERVNVELIALGTVKITDAEGNVDSSRLSVENSQTLFDNLLEGEWVKLKNAIENLTFAHTLFQNVALQDADFLSKSSADPDKAVTSE